MKPYDSFIFTHIPKCGGTSFREYIFEAGVHSGIETDRIYAPGLNGVGNDKNVPQLSEQELADLRHKGLRILACHAYFDVHRKYDLNMANPFYYVILREPVSRFISHYDFFYFKLGYEDYKGKSLNDLDDEALEHVIKSLCNVQIVYLTTPTRPSGPEVDEDALHRAMDILKNDYGCFGLLEYMDESLKILRAYAPSWLHFRDMFPHKNKNPGPHSKMEAPRASVLERIAYHNRYDIELYDYALSLFRESGARLV